MGSIVFTGQEEEPVHFNLSDRTDEPRECEIDSDGPVGVHSFGAAAGVCRPGRLVKNCSLWLVPMPLTVAGHEPR
jgi:hypothetical protein